MVTLGFGFHSLLGPFQLKEINIYSFVVENPSAVHPLLPLQGENISRRSLSTDEIIPGFSAVTTRFVDENSRMSSGVPPRLHLPDPPALHLPLFPFKLYLTFSPSISSSLIPFFLLSINVPLEPEGGIA